MTGKKLACVVYKKYFVKNTETERWAVMVGGLRLKIAEEGQQCVLS